jgi:hypothetical protein
MPRTAKTGEVLSFDFQGDMDYKDLNGLVYARRIDLRTHSIIETYFQPASKSLVPLIL